MAGIIVAAVGDDLALHHPGDHNDIATAAVLLGGPALYLARQCAVQAAVGAQLAASHLVGLATAGAADPGRAGMTPLLLSSATTAVLIVVAAWESISLRHPPNGKPSDTRCYGNFDGERLEREPRH